MRGWRRLTYLMVVSVAGSGIVTLNLWVGVILIKAGHLWWAIFFWGVIVFLIYEVNTDE